MAHWDVAIEKPWFYHSISGPFDTVESTIRSYLKHIKRYADRHYIGCLRIGATNNPHKVWRHYYKSGLWKEMVVLW